MVRAFWAWNFRTIGFFFFELHGHRIVLGVSGVFGTCHSDYGEHLVCLLISIRLGRCQPGWARVDGAFRCLL